MTKIALKVFRQLHDTLVGSAVFDPTGKSKMNPGARDGYAALWLWMSGGQPVERLTMADVGPISVDLRLDIAPVERQSVGYILPADPRDWLVLARIAAKECVRLDAVEYAYPEPMLLWTGWRGERRAIMTGCINLATTPTVAGLRLGFGKNYAELGEADLTQADADDDLLAIGQCLRRFYRISRV